MLIERGYRFYAELAVWWPLISPAEDYAEEAAEVLRCLRAALPSVREVLELGSGGGHNAVHLKPHLTLTLTDLSDAMLEISQKLNPECTHVHGDMRSLRLGRTFDAVFVHDAIEYMVSQDDLRAALATAFVHCRPGGVALFVPDDTLETYEPSSDHGGSDAPDGRGVRYLEWSHPLAEGAGSVRTDYVFTLRDADGHIEVVHETHTAGLFSQATWLRLITEAGFVAEAIVEQTTEDRSPRTLFLARRPAH